MHFLDERHCKEVKIEVISAIDAVSKEYWARVLASLMTTSATSPEMTALFNPLNGHLEQLFGYIDIGDLGLPDIQRPFVWKDSKVRDLFDSIYKGFPIGSYPILAQVAFRQNSSHRDGEEGYDDPVLLIIDGQ